MREFWWRLTRLEPTVVRGTIVATALLLGSLGVVISPQVPDALIGFLAALAAIAQALWTRAAVTPSAQVAVVVPDPRDHPNIVAPGEAATGAPAAAIIEAARAGG